jgi:hypothetical protein
VTINISLADARRGQRDRRSTVGDPPLQILEDKQQRSSGRDCLDRFPDLAAQHALRVPPKISPGNSSRCSDFTSAGN